MLNIELLTQIFYILLLIKAQCVSTFNIHTRLSKLSVSRGTWVHHDSGCRSYPINIYGRKNNNKIISSIPQFKVATKVLIITDDIVGPIYLNTTVQSLQYECPLLQVQTLILPHGEWQKNIDSVMKICDKALECGLDRKSLFVALGGGVVGDLVGFAASVYLRGVSFVQVPTTLMAMVDSAVGGKTAINRPMGKNMVGTFHNPVGVIANVDTLQTLSQRVFVSGISEMIKYGLVYEPNYFEYLESNMKLLVSRDASVLVTSIERACSIKATIVSKDEKDSSGIRTMLNLGHTFAHAIELFLGYGEWLHGEAVAVGISMAFDLSLRLDWIEEKLARRVEALVRQANLPTSIPPGTINITLSEFVKAMRSDKKVERDQIKLILPRGSLGHCVLTSVDSKMLFRTISKFLNIEYCQ